MIELQDYHQVQIDKINELILQGRYSSASDLLRFMIVWSEGGVYVD